jgi:hypothetical protein
MRTTTIALSSEDAPPMRHFLFGPVEPAAARSNLRTLVDARNCVTFNYSQASSWEKLQRSIPVGCRPEFIALWLPYQTIPPWIWNAPLPIIGLAGDWTLHWNYYRTVLPRCDLVFTDQNGVEAMSREGLDHVRHGVLYGGRWGWEDHVNHERDIDILFVGNLHGAVQRERQPWIRRLARLADRWRVAVASQVFGDDYRELLGRSRIVFNRSIRGEWNLRVCEAMASGALLFQEEDNAETRERLNPDSDCVFYNDLNLELLLDRFLTCHEQRRRITEQASRRSQEFHFERFWEAIQVTIEREWPRIADRAQRRPPWESVNQLRARVWQSVSVDRSPDWTLSDNLTAAVTNNPSEAELLFLKGVVEANDERLRNVNSGRSFATNSVASRLLTQLNFVESLPMNSQAAQDAIDQLLVNLEHRNQILREERDLPHVPSKFDEFRVEWERAAWSNAGDESRELIEKKRLIHWRALLLAGQARNYLQHLLDAVALRPDLWSSQFALGQALMLRSRFEEAAGALKAARKVRPLSDQTAVHLARCYQRLGWTDETRQLEDEMRQIVQSLQNAKPIIPADRAMPGITGET